MASLTNSSSLLSFPPKTAAIPRKTTISSSQSRPKRRKNYLRTKILKTLKTPKSPHQPPIETFEALEIVREEELSVSTNGDSEQFLGEFRVSESTEQGIVAGAEQVITARSVVELVLYFVGLFVVQTVCTVGFLMWSSKSGELELGGVMVDERKKEGSWVGGEGLGRVLGGELGRGGVDEGRMGEMIAEIRAMARAARESEVKSLSANGGVPSTADGIGDSKMKTNVEVEVDQRLSKVEKKLKSIADKSGLTLVNYVVKDRDKEVSGRQEANMKDEKMVFKKKLQFKSPSAKLNSKAKGFGNVNDGGRINGKGRSSSKASKYSVGTNATDSLDLTNKKLEGNFEPTDDSNSSAIAKEEESRQFVEDRSLKEGKTNKHVLIDTEKKDDEEGENLAKVWATTSGSNNSKSRGVRETCLGVAEPKNYRELGKEDESEQVASNVRGERLDASNDLWWMNLPYALAILLRNGSDQEGPSGLYSLKMNEGSLSYIVAFEDKNDATNFCHILETFFEDLGDIRADVVPLTRKELKDAMNSSAMKIMVVRKGQVKLYAGQPLTDIETTLRSLMK